MAVSKTAFFFDFKHPKFSDNQTLQKHISVAKIGKTLPNLSNSLSDIKSTFKYCIHSSCVCVYICVVYKYHISIIHCSNTVILV